MGRMNIVGLVDSRVDIVLHYGRSVLDGRLEDTILTAEGPGV